MTGSTLRRSSISRPKWFPDLPADPEPPGDQELDLRQSPPAQRRQRYAGTLATAPSMACLPRRFTNFVQHIPGTFIAASLARPIRSDIVLAFADGPLRLHGSSEIRSAAGQYREAEALAFRNALVWKP